MGNARRHSTWSLLAVYLGLSLFGELVHLSQCDSCSVDAASRAGGHTCSCHGHSHHPAKPPAHDESPQPDHDSNYCAVCQVLAIASDRAPLLVEVVTVDRAPEALIPILESAVSSEARDVQSRGPPVA